MSMQVLGIFLGFVLCFFMGRDTSGAELPKWGDSGSVIVWMWAVVGLVNFLCGFHL